MSNLNIRVINNMLKTANFMLYQEDINLNVENFKSGAWKYDSLAPGATYTTILPELITVAATEISDVGTVLTKGIPVSYNDSVEIFDNNNSLDVKKGLEKATDNTIDIYNTFPTEKTVVVQKDSRPLFRCDVKPNNKLSFAINPKIFIGLCDFEIKNDFFDAASISTKLEVDYEGQSYLTITLAENASTGAVSLTSSFAKY